jgi:hypothetical protein
MAANTRVGLKGGASLLNRIPCPPALLDVGGTPHNLVGVTLPVLMSTGYEPKREAPASLRLLLHSMMERCPTTLWVVRAARSNEHGLWAEGGGAGSYRQHHAGRSTTRRIGVSVRSDRKDSRKATKYRGPCLLAGGYLLFNDIPRNTICKWTPDDAESCFADPADMTEQKRNLRVRRRSRPICSCLPWRSSDTSALFLARP